LQIGGTKAIAVVTGNVPANSNRRHIDMATSVLKGQLSFGMVSFPVKLCAAAAARPLSSTPSLRLPVAHQAGALLPRREVLRSELVKGFEYDRDRLVIVEDRELRQIFPPGSRVRKEQEFVPAAGYFLGRAEAEWFPRLARMWTAPAARIRSQAGRKCRSLD
jgi:hypothetical protein